MHTYLARSSLIAFALQAAGVILIFISEALAARALGISNYGIFAIAWAWVQVLIPLGLLGTNQILLRYVPAYRSKGAEDLVIGVIVWSRNIGASISVLILVMASLIVFLSAGLLDESYHVPLQIAFLSIPLFVIIGQSRAIARGMGMNAKALFPDLVLRPTLFIIVMLVVIELHEGPLEAEDVVWSFVIATACSALVAVYWVKGHYLRDTSRTNMSAKEWLGTTLILTVLSLLQIVNNRLDVIMIGYFLGSESAGLYAPAVRVAEFVVFALAATNVAVAPTISALYAKNQRSKLQAMLAVISKWILISTALATSFLIIFGQLILGVFGDDYTKSYEALNILLVGQVLNALLGPVGLMLTMTGKHSVAVRIYAVSVLVNISLNALLIPVMGVNGAAIASTVSVVIWNISAWLAVKKYINVDSSFFSIFRAMDYHNHWTQIILSKSAIAKDKVATNMIRAWSRLTRKEPVHFLHIGKTGGNAVQEALQDVQSARYSVIFHGHDFTLEDVPEGEKFAFVLRDPISRFVSGFNSRKRRGNPRIQSPWSTGEKSAFTMFSTPKDLAAALASSNVEDRQNAIEALETIEYCKSFYKWFISDDYLQAKKSDIFFIGYQESLSDDFKRLKDLLGLSSEIQLPTHPLAANRAPLGQDSTITDEGLTALRKWYSSDLELIKMCKKYFMKDND